MVPGTKGEWSGEDGDSDQVAKPQEGVWQALLNPLSGGKPNKEGWRRREMVVGYQPIDRWKGGGGVNRGVDPGINQRSESCSCLY